MSADWELEQIRAELVAQCGASTAYAAPSYSGTHHVAPGAAAGKVTDLPMYQIDALVRRAASLQETLEGRTSAVSY